MARDNGEAFAEMQGWIDRLNQLGDLPAEVAKDVAPALDAEIRKNISAGVDPEGKPWLPTKDGKKPLANAGAALSVKAISSVVQAKLVGHVALHHLGAAKGNIRRQILPSSRLPQPMTAAIKAVAAKRFNDKMRKGG
jgi:hypothetical protein